MFIKPKKATIFIFASVFAIMSLVGCQATPTEDIIAQKEELDEYISATAQNDNVMGVEGEKWEYSKDYNSGRKLIVNADLIYNSDSGVPVASLEEKPFQSGTAIENLVKVLYPEHSIYSAPDSLTKGQIEETILVWKKQLADAKAKGDTGSIEFLENSIKEYEKLYNESTAESYPDADYNLTEQENGSYQANLIAVNGDEYIGIDVINWTFRHGSLLLVENQNKIAGEIKEEYINPQKVENDPDFQDNKKIAEDILKKLGIDYMTPSAVSVRENGYDYYYTRNVNGTSETFINSFFHIQEDNEETMNLWYAESLLIQIVDKEIAYIKWENPSILKEIDNENTQIISFDEAKNIFLKQMERILAPDISTTEGKGMASFFPENSQIHIDRIELGLTKLLMKNSDSYKLIPTWIFMGYTRGTVDGLETMTSSNSICYVTINALDGSIVDRAKMY